MPQESITIANSSVALSVLLVLSAMLLLWIEKLKIQTEVIFSSIRCFIQLIAVGYLIDIIFGLEGLYWMFLLVLAMTAVGAHTSKNRAGKIQHAWLICIVALLAGTLASMGVVFGFKMVSFGPRYFIPMAGIIVGNATRRLSIALDRLDAEMKNRRQEIEMALSLGATARQASRSSCLAAIKAALVPTIDGMKIIGLVQMPGAMLGMLLGGADPLDAVKLQILVIYLLLADITLTTVVGVELAYGSYFTRALQLKARGNSRPGLAK